jgi:hypothetical protein
MHIRQEEASRTTPLTIDYQPVNPRESMRSLPASMQRVLTIFSGKAFEGQTPWFVTPLYLLLHAAFSTIIGVVCSTIAITASHFWLLLLLPGWMLTLHGLRDLRIRMFHQCSHDNLFGHKSLDTWIGEALSTVLLVQAFPEYRYEHISEHHSIHHMTLADPTVKALLLTFGFRPDMTRRQLWSLLLRKLFSPLFHLNFFLSRITAHFLPAPLGRKFISLGFWVVVLIAVALTHSWLAFLVAWLIPFTLFFQVSNTLRLCVKHVFPQPGAKRQGKAYFASLTYGVFLGEALPNASLPFARRTLAWLRWIARMLFVHFPLRYLVLTGDTVCHDYHHRHPKSKNWANYIFARQTDIETGHVGWPAYQEIWGFGNALNLVFDSLRNADPLEFDVSNLRATHKHELFSAFDD